MQNETLFNFDLFDNMQVRKELEQKDMKAQAQILEIVGDLHYADEKPPDNVLFVCKLNPVTTDEVCWENSYNANKPFWVLGLESSIYYFCSYKGLYFSIYRISK